MIARLDLHSREKQLALVASAVLLAFVYGLYVGYSGRMLLNPSSGLRDGESVHGRFGHFTELRHQ